MASRGVFFALTKEEETRLLAAAGTDAVVEIMTDEIEERWDRQWLVEMDKSCRKTSNIHGRISWKCAFFSRRPQPLIARSSFPSINDADDLLHIGKYASF